MPTGKSEILDIVLKLYDLPYRDESHWDEMLEALIMEAEYGKR